MRSREKTRTQRCESGLSCTFETNTEGEDKGGFWSALHCLTPLPLLDWPEQCTLWFIPTQNIREKYGLLGNGPGWCNRLRWRHTGSYCIRVSPNQTCVVIGWEFGHREKKAMKRWGQGLGVMFGKAETCWQTTSKENWFSLSSPEGASPADSLGSCSRSVSESPSVSYKIPGVWYFSVATPRTQGVLSFSVCCLLVRWRKVWQDESET